jgi:Protein of unknown function (DUF4230)
MKAALIGLVAFAVLVSVLFTGFIAGRGMTLADGITSLLHGVSPASTTTITSRAAVIEQIKRIERLETTTYTIERVIEVKQTDTFWPDWLRGERLLLVAHGTVVAGVDLAGLSENDVIVSEDGASVIVNLPAVFVFNRDSILNNDKTYVYDRQRGILAPPNANLEAAARREADRQILLAACEGGILSQATTDAQRVLEQLLALLEIEVTVNSAPVPPCPITAGN